MFRDRYFCKDSIPFSGLIFSSISISSFLTFGLTSVSDSTSFISTSFSLDELEPAGSFFADDFEENASFDCFAGGFVPLGWPKNFLFITYND